MNREAPISLTPEDRAFLRKQLNEFRVGYSTNELNPIHGTIRYQAVPATLKEFEDKSFKLDHALFSAKDSDDELVLDENLVPLLKLVLMTQRRAVAADVDLRKTRTNNVEMISYLDSELAPFDEMLSKDCLKDVTAQRMPRLAEYLTLEEVEKSLKDRVRLAERRYDEKFHLLQAPALLLPDINYYRTLGATRGNCLAVGYLDIDDFKSLNTKYGHTKVDTDVLPVFMRALEAFVFARGHAYRIGGDEYVVLLANGQGADAALPHLQQRLAELSYNGVTERTFVSVGLCEVTPDCFLSDQGVVERANTAMRHAKAEGKNQIATYVPDGMYHDLILIVS